jgi:hypothetical protein
MVSTPLAGLSVIALPDDAAAPSDRYHFALPQGLAPRAYRWRNSAKQDRGFLENLSLTAESRLSPS